ncbi:MAG TPA: hypothetical protein VLH80_07285 [Nitrospiraceae bacterium]|nr:hypothetical protein [Nitrospiraceae bacterium]
MSCEREKVKQQLDTYIDERRKLFMAGFARFVLERGMETIAPELKGKPRERWIDVGRRLYGKEHFDGALRAELAAHPELRKKREKARAQG